MNEPVVFESLDEKINQAISGRIKEIRSTNHYPLPDSSDALVDDYVKKIERRYDVKRAKRDTDNAITLLYIAYNATPQEEGGIRTQIDGLAHKLIGIQQDSESVMRHALADAEETVKRLQERFGKWIGMTAPDGKEWIGLRYRTVSEGDNAKLLKTFIDRDLAGLADRIATTAQKIHDELLGIAGKYDEVIKSSTEVAKESEEALARRMKERQQIAEEITRLTADRDKFDSMVKELQTEVARFETMAKQYADKADKAEERAFITSLVGAIAGALAAGLPAIAMAACGDKSAIGASAQKTSAADGGDTQREIALKNQRAAKTAELAQSKDKVAKLEKEVKELEGQKDQQPADRQAKPPAPAKEDGKSGAKDDGKKPAKDAAADPPPAADKGAAEEIDKRIKGRKETIDAEKEKITAAEAALKALDDSLKEIRDQFTKASAAQEQQAQSLRDMQMKMLEKAEAYEAEKRNQTAELAKVKALLTGAQSDDEKMHLTILSLELSIAALKRMREIVVEVAFFFKSFADFMGVVATEAKNRMQSLTEKTAAGEIDDFEVLAIHQITDEFFISQVAEWSAVGVVSDKFVQNFADGWSALNGKMGEYLHDEKLRTFIAEAEKVLDGIVAERKAASDLRVVELKQWKDKVAGQKRAAA